MKDLIQKKYLYKIHKNMNIRIDRIKRVLDKAFYYKKFTPRINQQWKGPKIIKVYSLVFWKQEDNNRRKIKIKQTS